MIGYTHESHIAIIELQKHHKRNALDKVMLIELSNALDQAEADHTRIIVLTGEGSSFSAGADLDTALYSEEFLIAQLDILKKMQSLTAPIIAAVNGPALGAGFQLALAADVRILDPNARIGIPAPKIGVTVDAWTIKRFANLVGWGHARSLLFCLEEFSAQKCLAIGFANRLGVRSEAIDFAHMLSVLAPLTLQHYKKVFNDDGALNSVSEEIDKAMIAVWTSNDLDIGRQARIERMFPQFTGS